ncbi:MAG: YaeQ family protein [Gammaproteobacteria bacterium]|nr:YaeQ family protein [Gammaproteobacteria bacterium]
MALKATIHKADLQISDMDRNYYQPHQLTIARHPSENEERMMVRLLAFIVHADEALQFTKGLSSDDEPDIWQKSLSDEIELWIELGQPDEKRIRQACGRAKEVYIYTYSGHSAEIWWEQNANKLSSIDNLHLFNLPAGQRNELSQLSHKNMTLQATIQDDEIWLSDETNSVAIKLECWKE